MDERWQHIESLFAAAASLTGEERERYIREHCKDDSELVREIESLLNAESRAEDYFTNLAKRAGLSSLSDDAAGQLVGAYRLLHLLGHGGMGAVYLAERADRQFEKLVAIKLVPIALWGEDARQRFVQERKILARLEHPNIARLLDGGVRDDGVPYLVMEYVEGMPIDAYCDENHLGLGTRLKLFLEVCEAVAHAHRNLVIHRDLKPGNILVTRDGMLKLLDFGIAKLIGPQAEVGEHLTRQGSRPLTPAYASPELLRGEPVTTASDVYALGVLLYKLLSGRLPHDVSGLNELESLRLICETTPEPPSQAYRNQSAPGQGLDKKEGRQLAGDLDMIVMKAMHKEAARRYGSIEQFSEDICRHLARKPVHARPDTRGYRLSRFVKRHRIGFTASMALIALAAISGTLITSYAIRVTKQKDQITRERNTAKQEETFLANIFNSADPETARGKTITARDLLDRAAERIQKELADQPAVEADMLDQIGIIYYNLSMYEKAKPLLEKDLSLHEKIYGKYNMKTETSMNNLAVLDTVMGNYSGAIKLDKEALNVSKRLVGSHNMPVAILLSNLGNALIFEGKLRAAEKYLHQALTLKRQLVGPVDARIANTLYNLASVKKKLGEFDEAERLDSQALNMRIKVFGDNHPRVAESMNALGLTLYYEGKYSEAYKLFNESLSMKRKLYKGANVPTVVTLFHIAQVLRIQGHLKQAAKYVLSSLAMAKKIWPRPTPEIGVIYTGHGDILTDAGDYSSAHSDFNKALAIYAKTLSSTNYHVADTHVSIGRLFMKTRDYKKGCSQFRKALAIYPHSLPAKNWKIGRAQSELGSCLVAERQYSKAKPLLLSGFGNLRTQLGLQHPASQAALHRLISYYRARGNAGKIAQYSTLISTNNGGTRR